ncbi:DUF4352 domain-containing protein [Paenibacillus sp. S3N08]|uniref:DUF4352 domain-containing protein n=1 Tax=Paenibacillus agricola TaxID=2716264 RepID=A0ABX0JI50_9BACL|nr:DUF4352 domain-containing protein [Paenibacillus agricola]
MGFLRVLGWLFVPYIMVFVRWKNLGSAARVFGIIWAVVAGLSVIGNITKDEAPTEATTSAAVEQAKVTTASTAPTALDKEAKAKADAESKAQKEADAKAKKEADETAKAEAAAKAKADAEEKAPHLGESITIGSLGVGVAKDIKVSQTVGSQYLNQKAQGTYWIFGISIKNGDKAARMIDTSMFQLVSSDGTKYEADSTANLYANDAGKFMFQNINPGIQTNGFVVFDMPPDAKDKMADFKLKVDSGVGFKAGASADFILKSR